MKKIFLSIVTLAFGFSFISCDLDEPSYGKTTSNNFYKKQSDIAEALTGAYLQLRTTWNEYALNFYFVGDCSTDDALKGSSDGDRAEVMELQNFMVYTTNGEVGRRWEILYRLINRCNDVIAHAMDAQGDKDILTRYMNEAKALRAFGYYSLVTTFGGVPLITSPMQPEEILRVPRASADDVYKQIVSDLNDAAALPAKDKYSTEEQYHLTRGFAKTMLAKTYMFRGDFQNAEKVLRDIVETDHDYALLPDYGMNWRKEYENSSESVFELPNKVYDKSIATGTNVPHFFTSRDVPGYQGYGFHVPTTDLFNAFDKDDPRQTYVFTRTGDRYVGDKQAQDNHQSATGFHDYKMTVPSVDKAGFDVWMISYNIRLIRYADVLLLYAEALNENGKAPEALKYLNQVRQRARNTNPMDPRKDQQAYVPVVTARTLPDITVTNKDELREIIWHERRVELAMEGWRRDDLMRQRRFGEVMKAYAAKYNVQKGRNFNDKRDYLLPIPQGEIDKSNNVLTQNPEY
ncbi:RagB/SusD family nutrient uptake outer membrane protein [Prevotella sp. A2931]|uniref:RagB/SusD family nutrient uptake outer membrane protein n=1 Tax=Prevotella illustrans TaxID=2800387 RepID=A0ABS3M3Y5_9BACT|nr:MULTISPECIES: RagB/SusD family nutrient uptake outer membrane protein [Prevotella]MBO1362889.1 RagB/SusD family nutrient uptake outer membrane protein [Prevotella illustrans]PTL25951.1 RagB/SusD family nutrient uptake outer membrane protein [Prevotella sp. oral taxon 820]